MELIYIFWLFLAFLGSAIFANAIKYWDHLDDSAREAAKAPEAFGYAIGKILKFTFSVLFRLIRLSGPTQFKQLEKRARGVFGQTDYCYAARTSANA